MHIDKWKDPEHGGYTAENECWYQDAHSFMTIEILKFCGCGDQTAALTYVRDVLKHIDSRNKPHRPASWYTPENRTAWEQEQLARAQKDRNFYASVGAEYFVYYMLDHLQLIDHGSMVPGWLSDKGREVLEDLEILLQEEDEEPQQQKDEDTE
jgi:hypothetical protein